MWNAYEKFEFRFVQSRLIESQYSGLNKTRKHKRPLFLSIFILFKIDFSTIRFSRLKRYNPIALIYVLWP